MKWVQYVKCLAQCPAQSEHSANVRCYCCCHHYHHCCYWEKVKMRKENGEMEDKERLYTQSLTLQYGCQTYQGVFLGSTKHPDWKTAMGHPWRWSSQDSIRWKLWFPSRTVLATIQLRGKETRSMVGSGRSSHGSTTHAPQKPVSSVGTASRVPAMDTPVTRVTPFREDQGTLSPSVIYSLLTVLLIQIQFTNRGCFYHWQHDLVTCWHILSFSVSRETKLGC